jgi:transposase
VTDSPRDDLESLPEGIEALRALVLRTIADRDATLVERDAAVTERDILLAQNDRLRHLLLQLRRMHFGPRSERLPEEQLQLGLEALEQAIAKENAEAEKRDPELGRDNAARRRASRGALPAHLPRIEVTLAPEDTACPCCRASMTVIGEDTSERLDVIPAQFRVIVTKRPKLACRACTGIVVQAPAPARLIEGGIPTEATVAHVLVARYADHLPLYRQAQILARQGVIIERSTLSFWMGYAAAGRPALFAGFVATTAESDFSGSCIIGFDSSSSRCGTRGISPLAKPETSRFPRKERPHMPGSSTTPGQTCTRDDAPAHVAFHDYDHVSTRNYLAFAGAP